MLKPIRGEGEGGGVVAKNGFRYVALQVKAFLIT